MGDSADVNGRRAKNLKADTYCCIIKYRRERRMGLLLAKKGDKNRVLGLGGLDEKFSMPTMKFLRISGVSSLEAKKNTQLNLLKSSVTTRQKPALSFMRPFGCPVTILNTLDHLGTEPNWMFDIDTLTMSMNYQPVFVGNQTNGNAGTKANIDAVQARKKTVLGPQYVLLPLNY
nr:hypothetical protein [Tanacetum cinerariifolium]